MSVQSTFFGVTKLTDEDAKKFHRQVTYGRPNNAAIASLERGKVLLRAMELKGHVKLTVQAAARKKKPVKKKRAA